MTSLAPARPILSNRPGAELIAEARRRLAEGRRREAAPLLAKAEAQAADDPAALQMIGELHLQRQAYPQAIACYRRALALAPGAPGPAYNLATALVATGDHAEAEALFARVTEASPGDGDAWYNRVTLRRWSETDNLIAPMRAALAGAAPTAAIGLHYALAKTYEDLGQAEAAFAEVQQGAALRRARLSYRVEMDIEAMAAIASAYDAGRLAAAPARDSGRPGPILVLGSPRSGTTLVERMLASHSRVGSIGETPDFALALMDAAGPAPDKAALIRQAAACDLVRIAERYRRRLSEYDLGREWIVDKTPSNSLYIGAVALALPEARIVHVRRDPMDVGYALYKTLFRTGCPYSYDLVDIGRYLAASARLMQHWRACLPGRIIEVDYESLVEAPEAQARGLIEACGLDWEPGVLDFHANPAPSATASAAQVRRPIYRDSAGLWRRHAARLRPLADTLRREGVIP